MVLLFKKCSVCLLEMMGVSPNSKHRSKCEKCGGNTTVYDEKNPHPESQYGK